MKTNVEHQIRLGPMTWDAAQGKFRNAHDERWSFEGSHLATSELPREWKLAKQQSENVHGWQISVATAAILTDEEEDPEDLVMAIIHGQIDYAV